jgi:hypothetical protein
MDVGIDKTGQQQLAAQVGVAFVGSRYCSPSCHGICARIFPF